MDTLTASRAIEVNRTVDRDGYVGLGGSKVLSPGTPRPPVPQR
jgi:hypothetical protein